MAEFNAPRGPQGLILPVPDFNWSAATVLATSTSSSTQSAALNCRVVLLSADTGVWVTVGLKSGGERGVWIVLFAGQYHVDAGDFAGAADCCHRCAGRSGRTSGDPSWHLSRRVSCRRIMDGQLMEYIHIFPIDEHHERDRNCPCDPWIDDGLRIVRHATYRRREMGAAPREKGRLMRDTDNMKWALLDLLKLLDGVHGGMLHTELARIAKTLGVELPVPPKTEEEVEV